MADDLSAPLRSRKARAAAQAAARAGRVPWTRIIFSLLLVVALGVAARVILVDDPTGGRPSAEIAVDTSRPANPVADVVKTPAPEAAPDAPTVIEGHGGGPKVTETTSGGARIITIDDDTPAGQSDAPVRDENGAIPDLVEETKDGGIPRVGPTGLTPFKAYARPALTPDSAGGRPLIAVIVTGMGLNETGTLEAINTLPAAATLAFAPYGKNLKRTVAAAQSAGHELLLETPLEPFDYPDNDPGPQTLITGQPPRSNIERLFWLMSRFSGYVGLINHMGARFTASGADFTPVMEELGVRGLGYLDDGSSNRSLAPQLAASNKVPFARADMMLDANPAEGPIKDALAQLEALAREKGMAIGVMSALPVSVSTFSAWAEGLEEKGVELVPISALMK